MKKPGVYDSGMGRRGAYQLLGVLTSGEGLGRVLVMVLAGPIVGGSSAKGSEG
ncbi:hypothetical protein CCP3SC1_20006 [Gammaproteobacteria bacterium]